MQKLADAGTVRAIDSAAVRRYGIRGIQLMENAGRGLADVVAAELEKTGGVTGRRVVVVAGKGNNGGDGYVAARHLANSRVDVTVYSLARVEDLKGDASANAKSWLKMGGRVELVKSGTLRGFDSALAHASVVVDCIFGTGLGSAVKGLYARVIESINAKARVVVAADIPSGIDATTGEVHGTAIVADVTATMALVKLGLYLYPGRCYAGSVVPVDIGAPLALSTDEKIRWNLVTPEDVARILKPRQQDTHKGTFGHLLITGGSPGKSGAVYLAAMGAMRAGSGLVTIAHPEGLAPALEAKTTEVMTAALAESRDGRLGVSSYDGFTGSLKGKAAVVVGPGLGTSKDVSAFMEKAATSVEVPMVIDADGLNAIAESAGPGVLKKAAAARILTPHPGEIARLLKISNKDVQKDRVGTAGKLAKASGSIVVLKGASTVVAEPDGSIYINPTGNAALATAGTGDVLSGMIGAMMAQGYPPLAAVLAGVYVHGECADVIKKETGETGAVATDLLPIIPRVLNSYIRCSSGSPR